MLFNAAHTFKAYISEYSTHSGKEDKLKTNILHTVEVKIHPRNFSNNEVPDLNENTSGSTNLAEKKARMGWFTDPYSPPSVYTAQGKLSVCILLPMQLGSLAF